MTREVQASEAKTQPLPAAPRCRKRRDYHHHPTWPRDRTDRSRGGSPTAGNRSGARRYPRAAQAHRQGLHRGDFGVASRRPQILMALVIDASIAATWALRGSVRTARRRIGRYGPRTPAQVDGLALSADLPLANLERAIARRASAGAGRARAIRGRRFGIDIFRPCPGTGGSSISATRTPDKRRQPRRSMRGSTSLGSAITTRQCRQSHTYGSVW